MSTAAPKTAIALLESTINKVLSLDPEVTAQFAPFSGRALAIRFPAWDIGLVLLPTGAGITIMQLADYEKKPDAQIEGSPLSLLQLFKTAHAKQAFFQGDITLSGDIHFAQAISALCQKLDIDWEEQLSKITGDVAAHGLSTFAKRLIRFKNTVAESIKTNVGEYVIEEARATPSKAELKNFYEAVEKLRDDVDRTAMIIESKCRVD